MKAGKSEIMADMKIRHQWRREIISGNGASMARLAKSGKKSYQSDQKMAKKKKKQRNGSITAARTVTRAAWRQNIFASWHRGIMAHAKNGAARAWRINAPGSSRAAQRGKARRRRKKQSMAHQAAKKANDGDRKYQAWRLAGGIRKSMATNRAASGEIKRKSAKRNRSENKEEAYGGSRKARSVAHERSGEIVNQRGMQKK